MAFTVLYDANVLYPNVLYPNVLRDVLIRLAQTGLVHLLELHSVDAFSITKQQIVTLLCDNDSGSVIFPS